jgi:hypothetical protein
VVAAEEVLYLLEHLQVVVEVDSMALHQQLIQAVAELVEIKMETAVVVAAEEEDLLVAVAVAQDKIIHPEVVEDLVEEVCFVQTDPHYKVNGKIMVMVMQILNTRQLQPQQLQQQEIQQYLEPKLRRLRLKQTLLEFKQ